MLEARGINIDDAHRYTLLREVASALAFLHKHGVCVGDISPKNLLFSLTPHEAVYFIDCDAMRINGVSALPQVETPGWETPAGEELATIYSDTYKLGLLALRLLVGDHDTKNPPTSRPPHRPPCARSSPTPSPTRHNNAHSPKPGPTSWATPSNKPNTTKIAAAAGQRRPGSTTNTHRALQTNGTKRSFHAAIQPAAVRPATVHPATLHPATAALPGTDYCRNRDRGRSGDRGVRRLTVCEFCPATQGIKYSVHLPDVLSHLFLALFRKVPPTPRRPTPRPTRRSRPPPARRRPQTFGSQSPARGAADGVGPSRMSPAMTP